MTNAVELYKLGTEFATRQTAMSIADSIDSAPEIMVDFSGVNTAAPSFLDQLVGDLTQKSQHVSIIGVTQRIEELTARVVERRNLNSRFTIESSANQDEEVALPKQDRVYRAPARFGHTPVAATPLGWDSRNPGFRNHYPLVRLPTQVLERISLGALELESNRLIWGDCLHVTRTLDSESVDLVYLDPPFFSNRNYNVIWGDEHERRSFSDIWESGLDGYLIWLNARLYEMKRVLKATGSIYVHCDWHASHYIKVEMDKIFGYENFRNEIVWSYGLGGSSRRYFSRKHDVVLFYSKTDQYRFSKPLVPATSQRMKGQMKGMLDTWTDIPSLNNQAKERVGYPTQKPEALIKRIIEAASREGDTVLDAFVGGGTTPVVAQQLGRRWIAIDQSRVAIAVTAERLKGAAISRPMGQDPVPDFTIEHWGVYEMERLSGLPAEDFREIVLEFYDARIQSSDEGIHGYRGARAQIPVWVGPPGLTATVVADDVNSFAQAIARLDRYQGEEGLRDGIMLAWGFSPGARRAAAELREREGVSLAFVRIEQVRIDSPEFRRHIVQQSTERGDYTGFLTFVQPAVVEVAHRRIKPLHYEFDASDTQTQNADAKIVNVQWDFDYDGVTFRAARGEWFHRRRGDNEPILDAQHTFPRAGVFRIACRVQDDRGGEGEWGGRIEVR